MQTQYTVREAKARLSELLDLAASGAEIEIHRTKGKKGSFRLVSVDAVSDARRPGILRGKIGIPDDFDDESPDVLAMFGA